MSLAVGLKAGITASIEAQGYRIAEGITRDRAKSFAFASAALDGETRRAAFAVYAFCRRCDDAVDDAKDEAHRRSRVDALWRQLDAAYAGDHDEDPVLAAFGDTVRSRGVPREAFVGLVRGMEQDLAVNRYETWDALLDYCELAAGTVGRMMAAVFGVRTSRALTHAAALGRAMQLTNVMRDVREDLEVHQRVYLPEEALRARGLAVENLAAFARAGRLDDSAPADAFRDLMDEGAQRAEALYLLADEGVPWINSAAARGCVRMMRATYSDILSVMRDRRWDVFRGRASTGLARKVRVSGRALLG